MEIPLSDIRQGCALLIQRIRRHASDAMVLLQTGAGHDQGALILMLIGFEELGKLLEYIQEAAKAEHSSKNMVNVRDYRDPEFRRNVHTLKAELTSDYFRRSLHLVDSAMQAAGAAGLELGPYSDHLSAIGADFRRTRRHAMYLDFENGIWTSGKPVDTGTLTTDIFGLLIGAGLIEAAMEGQTTFAGVVNKSIEGEKNLQDLVKEVIRAILQSGFKPSER